MFEYPITLSLFKVSRNRKVKLFSKYFEKYIRVETLNWYWKTASSGHWGLYKARHNLRVKYGLVNLPLQQLANVGCWADK